MCKLLSPRAAKNSRGCATRQQARFARHSRSVDERSFEGLDKLFAAIDARREPELDRFIFALGIRHIGETTAAVLAKTFSDIETLRKTGLEAAAAGGDVHEVFPRSTASVTPSGKRCAISSITNATWLCWTACCSR